MITLFADEYERGYLAAVDSHLRALRTRVARHPDPRDPEYDEDAVDALEGLEREQKVALREFELGSLTLNELMVAVKNRLGATYHGQLDTIRYELAKAMVEETL